MGVSVAISAEALRELKAIPVPIHRRVDEIANRLKRWPAVSGVKALRGKLKGNYRIRTGDYRVVFIVSADGRTVTIWKVGYRGSVYD